MYNESQYWSKSRKIHEIRAKLKWSKKKVNKTKFRNNNNNNRNNKSVRETQNKFILNKIETQLLLHFTWVRDRNNKKVREKEITSVNTTTIQRFLLLVTKPHVVLCAVYFVALMRYSEALYLYRHHSKGL